jgi:hypothetical protein
MADSPKSTPEQDKLLDTGLPLARSQDAADHAALLKMLTDASFLDRLDTPAEVLNLRYRIRIERIIQVLAANPSPSARAALVSLSTSAAFKKEDRRTDALIRASAVVRPPPAPLVQFWDAHSQPSDGFTNLTIVALIDNGTPDAIALFERKLADPGHDEEDKANWLHCDVLTHRNDEPLLLGCERLVAGPLAPEIKSALVDSLFDYRPDEWYGEVRVFTPPDRAKATPAARATLDRIARHVLTHLQPTPRQERAIEEATGVTRKSMGAP